MLKGERLSGGVEEGDGVGGIFGVVDVEMDEPGAAIDGDIEEALPDLAVRSAQLGQPSQRAGWFMRSADRPFSDPATIFRMR